MIRIVSQSAIHQYDENGRAITTWDSKKCSWIVNEEFENEDIDWWGEDNDFPAGTTLKEFLRNNPNWDKIPDISVTWTWETKEDMMKCLGRPTSIQEIEWYAKEKFPNSTTRSWGYIDAPKETAVESFGKYCGFNKFSNTKVSYNGEVIFEGKLEW